MNVVDIFIVFEDYKQIKHYLIHINNLLNLQKADISLVSIDIRFRSIESSVCSARICR